MVITMEKIGLQLYSIRNHFNTQEEISDTFKKLKALGYDQAEMAGSHGLSYDRFYELAKEQGIEIIGTHDNFQEMCTDIDGMIAKHKQLHVKNMGIGGLFLYDENAVNGIPVEKVRVLVIKRRVRGRVVIHNVDHALHAAGVNFADQLLEIVHRAIGGVDASIVPVGIRAAERSFLAFDADGMNRQKPDDIGSQCADAVQIRNHRAERSLGRVVSDINRINDLILKLRVCIGCHLVSSSYSICFVAAIV